MIVPIIKYGSPILRKHLSIVTEADNMEAITTNLFDTVKKNHGVGLAAPQIGLSIRVIVIDLAPLKEDNPELGDFRVTLINPEILEESEEEVAYDEGCLSIPGINETVVRPEYIKIHYYDADFNEHELELDGFKARVVQHEYDHLEGHLFTDLVKPLRRQLIKSKLTNISKGKTTCKYKIK